jgi:hypothetical protein
MRKFLKKNKCIHTNGMLENGLMYLYYNFKCNVINAPTTYLEYKYFIKEIFIISNFHFHFSMIKKFLFFFVFFCIHNMQTQILRQLEFKHIWIYAWTLNQFQPTISHTLECITTQIWWLANMEYKYLKLWFCVVVFECFHLIYFFHPHKCISLVILGQVVCPNTIKSQFIKQTKTRAQYLSHNLLSKTQRSPRAFGL